MSTIEIARQAILPSVQKDSYEPMAVTPSLVSILASFQKEPSADPALLKAILECKRAEDQRLAALSLAFVAAAASASQSQYPSPFLSCQSTSPPPLSECGSSSSSSEDSSLSLEPQSPIESDHPAFSKRQYNKKVSVDGRVLSKAQVMDALRAKLDSKAKNRKRSSDQLNQSHSEGISCLSAQPSVRANPKRRRTSSLSSVKSLTQKKPVEDEKAVDENGATTPSGLALLLNAAEV